MSNGYGAPATRPHPQTGGVNPFARALAEARGSQHSDPNFADPSSSANPYNPFLNENEFGTPIQDPAEQQRQLLEQQRRERLREQLHRQVNPVETHDVFSAREQQVKKQIDEIRYELKLLSHEVKEFHQEIEVSVMANVANPGQDGRYYFVFFQQLKRFIQLLRQKIHSARTWATTAQNKKKRRKNSVGLEIAGKAYEQTTTVFDHMHHERSTAYAGS